MSQETPTDLPEMPSTAAPGAAAGTALSSSEVDQRSASRILRVLVIFGWGMAAVVVVSALLGFGTPLSNTLAFCWFAALKLPLLLWSKLTLQWHRGVAHSDVGQGVDHIPKRADGGLYAAKNSGRNKVVTV